MLLNHFPEQKLVFIIPYLPKLYELNQNQKSNAQIRFIALYINSSLRQRNCNDILIRCSENNIKSALSICKKKSNDNKKKVI